MPGNADGSLDGIALKPLTVAFHEAAFIATLQAENQQPFWFLMSAEQRQRAGNPMGPANPQALNRYSYVQNNPLKYTDPTGHMVHTISLTFTGYIPLPGQFGGAVGGTLALGISWDHTGRIALSTTAPDGEFGSHPSLGIGIAYSNFWEAHTTIDTIEGAGGVIGTSLARGPYSGTLEYTPSLTPDKSAILAHGVTITTGVGVGQDIIHAGFTQTTLDRTTLPRLASFPRHVWDEGQRALYESAGYRRP